MVVHLPVLLVEDEPDDVALLRYAFNQAHIKNPLVVARDGEEALDYLHGKKDFADRSRYPFPCLIITDIKMPRMDGFQFLESARAEGFLSRVPAIAMSNSCFEHDLAHALELGATAYYVKPARLRKLIALARELNRKWFAHHSRRAVPQHT